MTLSPPTSRRVLIIGKASVLTLAIQTLLMDDPDLEITEVVPSIGEEELKEIFMRIHPEAVVLTENPSLDLAHFFSLLRDVPLESTLRVIVAGLDKIALDVYEKQSIVPRQGSRDLVALVRGEPIHFPEETAIPGPGGAKSDMV